MKHRVCVIGNSHVAALKRGWDAMAPDFGDIAIDLFGAPGTSFANVSVVEGRIVAGRGKARQLFKATGGRKQIVLGRYDAVAVVGGAKLSRVAELLHSCCPPFMNAELYDGAQAGGDAGLAQFYGEAEPALVSDGLMKRFFAARFTESAVFGVLSGIAAQGGTRLLHLPAPFPSSEMLTRDPGCILSRVAAMGLGPRLAETIGAGLQAAVGGKAELVRPPEEILVEGIFTEKAFAERSTRLSDDCEAHGEEDLFHMNADYGAIMLRRLIGRLAA